MKVKINNVEWEIKEVTNDKMKSFTDKYRKNEEYEYICGYTSYIEQVILINEIMKDKKHVLYHELVHAYLYSFGLYCMESYDEEDICNIASKSSVVINEILDKYFKKTKNIIIDTSVSLDSQSLVKAINREISEMATGGIVSQL